MLKKLFFLFIILFIFSSCTQTTEGSDDISLESETSTVVSEDSTVEESASDESIIEESENEGGKDEMVKIDVPVLSIISKGSINKANYVSATVQLRDPSGEFDMIYDANAEVKIRGNSTAGALKRPLNIRFSSSRNVLGLGESKKWYLLSNPYDKTLMRNKLAYDLAQVLGLSNTPKCTYVDLYLNGEFFGNYLLCESIGIGEDRVDLNIDNNDFLFEVEPYVGYSNPTCLITPILNFKLGYNDRDKPTLQQEKYVIDFFEKAETAVKNKDWERITEYFDMDSFVNYYLLKEFLKSVDTESSVRYYIKDGVLYAGPVWDIDLSMGNCDPDYYKVYNNVGGSGDSTEGLYLTQVPSQWFGLFMKMDEFRELLRDRMEEMYPVLENLYKKNELGESRIDVLLAKYGHSFLKNYDETNWRIYQRYSNLERIPDKTFSENVDYMRSWLEKRHEWINNELGITIE